MSLLPNEQLLNYNFETYRVNLNQLIREEKEVQCELFDWNLTNNVVNISKVKAYGLYNNLILDDFNTNDVYFISKDAKVFKTTYCEESGHLSEPYNVFTTDNSLTPTVEQLPPNLYFPSPNIACFADGYGYLNIIHTSNRNISRSGDEENRWKLLCSTSLLENDIISSLLECRIQYIEGVQQDSSNTLLGILLHCCFLRISTKNISTNSKNVDLLWITYKYSEESHQLFVASSKLWKGNSPPEMVTFSNDFKTLEIISNHHFRFISADITYDGLCKDNIGSVPCWCNESEETILIEYYLNIPVDKFTLDFKYPTESNNEMVIFLILNDKEPLELYRSFYDCRFNEDKTTWCIENELLIVTLRKTESNEACEEIISKKPKLTIIGMEEIDNLDDTELGVASFDSVNGTIVGDEISISKNEWLFKTRLSPDQPLSVCLRFNVDGLLWTKASSGDQWTHRYTLNAFGYVAAAKVDRKYMCCSLPHSVNPAIEFAVISDWKRELYVLMQSRRLDSNMTVKNRSTGQIVDNVADEYLVTLDKSKEIMGMVANSNLIFVLYAAQSTGVTGVAAIKCC